MNTHLVAKRFCSLLLACWILGGCGGANGDEVQVAETRSDGAKLTSEDKEAAAFVRGKLAEHWVKSADGWTTQFQAYNVLGELMPGATPTLLYKQYREMRFTMAPATLTEAMKLNGSDYRAEVAFKSSPVRYYRTEASYDAPQGWSNWKDEYLENLAVERRNGKWIISDANYFEGILPTGPIPSGSGQ